MSIRRYCAPSDEPFARSVRRTHRAVRDFTLPAPRIVFRPILWAVLAARSLAHLARRLLICEPLFKAHCEQFGRRVRTGSYLHWVDGRGDILIGDDVLIDGKCHFLFAARFADRPTLA